MTKHQEQEICKANVAESYPYKFDFQCKREGKFSIRSSRRLKTNREISLRTIPGDV